MTPKYKLGDFVYINNYYNYKVECPCGCKDILSVEKLRTYESKFKIEEVTIRPTGVTYQVYCRDLPMREDLPETKVYKTKSTAQAYARRHNQFWFKGETQ